MLAICAFLGRRSSARPMYEASTSFRVMGLASWLLLGSKGIYSLGFMGIMLLCSLLSTSKLVKMAIREDQDRRVSEFGAFR